MEYCGLGEISGGGSYNPLTPNLVVPLYYSLVCDIYLLLIFC